jgi:hypothetical protein
MNDEHKVDMRDEFERRDRPPVLFDDGGYSGDWLREEPPALTPEEIAKAEWEDRRIRDAVNVLVVIVLSLILWTWLNWGEIVGKARGHEAISGWAYPSECCSGVDCYPINAATEIAVEPVGYRILATGEFVPFEQAKVSGDGLWHRCSQKGDRKLATICLYVPAGV